MTYLLVIYRFFFLTFKHKKYAKKYFNMVYELNLLPQNRINDILHLLGIIENIYRNQPILTIPTTAILVQSTLTSFLNQRHFSLFLSCLSAAYSQTRTQNNLLLKPRADHKNLQQLPISLYTRLT